jgi:hypothetical protein
MLSKHIDKKEANYTHEKKIQFNKNKDLSKKRPAIFLKIMPVTCLQMTSSCPKTYRWINCSLKAAALLPR